MIVLPAEPGPETLARDWTLSAADRAQTLAGGRGDLHRRWFALQLCVLRRHGRFLDGTEADGVPTAVVNHLGRQLGLAPVLLVERQGRAATQSEQEARIRAYLGFAAFDADAQSRLERVLGERAAQDGLGAAELAQGAAALLAAWKVVRPATSTLERLAAGVYARAQAEVFGRVAARLSPRAIQGIEELLGTAAEGERTGFFYLKRYPPAASHTAIRRYLARYRQVEALEASHLDLTGVLGADAVRRLAELARQYDAGALRRFAPAKRHALSACFLVEARRTLLDHAVEMHDQMLTDLCRRCRHEHEGRQREARRRHLDDLATLLDAGDVLLVLKEGPAPPPPALLAAVDGAALRDALRGGREFRRLESGDGYLERLRACHPGLRRGLADFFALPFEAEPGSAPLLSALTLARRLAAGEQRGLPAADTPVGFLPAAFRRALRAGAPPDDRLDRALWEVGLALAVKDALRSGDLHLPASRRHVSFWNLVYREDRWAGERERAYADLALPAEPAAALHRLGEAFARAAQRFADGLATNPFATVEDGRLRLHRPDALPIPENVVELRRRIEAALPQRRIEEVLLEVDALCGFSREFRALGGYEPRGGEDDYLCLLSALIAHGTNLGLSAMGHSVEGLSGDQLAHASRWRVREATVQAANAVLVNYHHGLAASAVWGLGAVSSSDGQRFGLRASSLLGAFYPRYFGYYERAVTVYTHVSDQHSVFSTRVISCAEREALYVLEGLLDNDTALHPRAHATDTHGYTEGLFGLCHLLGFAFMPRIKDLKDQQLYRPGRAGVLPGALEGLFRGAVDADLIAEQWDQLTRVAASLRARLSPAHLVVRRLVGAAPGDRLARALTALGRLVKTIYVLRYLHEEDLRRGVQLQLNRGENRHALARWLFFARQGEFAGGDYEEIMNKASCLSLLSNAVLVWNTGQIARVVERLRAGGLAVDDADLARVSPLLHAHVIPSGTYFHRRPAATAGTPTAKEQTKSQP